MTLREFIQNPAGKGDSSLNRATLISTLNSKYDKLVKDKTIQFTVYKDGRHGTYYFHMIIPSETERDNTYDVVFLFEDRDKKHKKDPTISGYDIRVFANSPSFAYTFAKVYKDNDMFIDSLGNKFEKEILKLEPEVRNRYGIVNYDKYVYFGAKFIDESRLMNKSTLNLRSNVYVAKVFQSKIRSLAKIMDEYKKAKNKLKKAKDKDKPKSERTIKKNTVSRVKTAVKTVKPKQPKKPKTTKVKVNKK